MIDVYVTRGSTNEIRSFTISGHADAGPYGYDLVCAAVSALSFGAINAVDALCGVKLQVETDDDAGGFLRCDVPHVEKETEEKVQLLLEGMLVSLRSVAEEYGEHIVVHN